MGSTYTCRLERYERAIQFYLQGATVDTAFRTEKRCHNTGRKTRLRPNP